DDAEDAELQLPTGRADGLLQGAAVLQCRLTRPELDPREGPCLDGPRLPADGLAVQDQRREVLDQRHGAGAGVVDRDGGGVAAVGHRLALVAPLVAAVVPLAPALLAPDHLRGGVPAAGRDPGLSRVCPAPHLPRT